MTNPIVRVIVAVIENSEGKILLLQRSPGKKWAPNLWNIVSGHIEPGEEPLTAVFREIEEETGLAVELKETFPMYDVDYDGKIWRTSAYRFLSQDADPVLNEEHVAFRWAAYSELSQVELVPIVFEDFQKMGFIAHT
ncbi:MAG: NUDIX hydrolase [bacterium]|nr:NUDIX hydrolase [bacterium]